MCMSVYIVVVEVHSPLQKPNSDWLNILWFDSFFSTAESLHCYVCSSDKLEQCSTLHSLKELPSELCPADMASCFTKVEGKFFRVCLCVVDCYYVL